MITEPKGLTLANRLPNEHIADIGFSALPLSYRPLCWTRLDSNQRPLPFHGNRNPGARSELKGRTHDRRSEGYRTRITERLGLAQTRHGTEFMIALCMSRSAMKAKSHSRFPPHNFGLRGTIRTCDHRIPSAGFYQAELRAEKWTFRLESNQHPPHS